MDFQGINLTHYIYCQSQTKTLSENVTCLTLSCVETWQEIVFQITYWGHISTITQLQWLHTKAGPDTHHRTVSSELNTLTDQTHLNLYGS